MAKRIDLEILAGEVSTVTADGYRNIRLEIVDIDADHLISDIKDHFSAKEIIQDSNLTINDFIEFFGENDILKEIGESAAIKYFGLET